MLKTTLRPLVAAVVKGGSPIPQRIRTEAAWLAIQVDPAHLDELARSSRLGITGEEIVEFHARSTADDLDWRYVRQQRRRLSGLLGGYRRQGPLVAWTRKAVLRMRSWTLARRLGLGIGPRRLVGPAPLLAAVGADGSGKTRLTRDLETWLGWKLAVHHVYFGQPKTGIVFRLLNKPGSLLRHRLEREGSHRSLVSGLLARLTTLTDGIKWVVLAVARRRSAARALSLTRRGEVVIAERYPLPQFWSMEAPMDGPRMQGQTPAALARFEMRQYRAIAPPALTLVLRTDLTTLRDRKVDLTIEEHVAKVEAVAALATGPGMVVIDAAHPYEQVLVEAKRHIWEAILASR